MRWRASEALSREGCCTPSRESGGGVVTEAFSATVGNASLDGMVLLSGGPFAMGAEDSWAYPDDGEGPVREVRIGSFWIDVCAVSNAQFTQFVESTRFTTEAERFEWSFVFAGVLPDDFPPTQAAAQAPWWREVEGADWRHPDGPTRVSTGGSTILSCTSPGTTPRRTAPGLGRGFRPRPNGSSQHAEGWRSTCSRGATKSSRTAST